MNRNSIGCDRSTDLFSGMKGSCLAKNERIRKVRESTSLFEIINHATFATVSHQRCEAALITIWPQQIRTPASVWRLGIEPSQQMHERWSAMVAFSKTPNTNELKHLSQSEIMKFMLLESHT